MLSNGVKRELTWVVTSTWLLLFFAWLTGFWVETFAFFILIYIARNLWSMHKFEKWMEGRKQSSYPPASGFWSELTYLVSKKQRALEKHADLNLYKSEQFKAASMLIPDAIVSLDQRNVIEWFNTVSKSLLGVRRQDVGSKIESVIRQPEFVQYLKSQKFHKPLTVNSNYRQSRTVEMQVIPYFENHKLLVVRDITELYQLAQIRRDFIANASHELRTPLTVLRGYLEVMIDTPGEHHKAWGLPLEHMETQSLRMQAIIEDLLTLSTIEAESITAVKEVVDVPLMLHQLEIDAKQLGNENHQFTFEVEEALTIKGYAEPLKSVFMNLVSNAVRYSPDGGEIDVRWFKENANIVFEVQDSGLGISQEHIPRLTERFYRVDKDRSRVTGGTGLGLAIVKHVLERHNARLYIDSVLGKGSVFRCEFPVAKS
ncbi:phosphate regulon sensor histidine kinase PhoR [Thiomicrorhabdus lithotrophica]|uniref:histidine kinase n=1 Tax=Thiomicrorhabdus lithotrophica TaxID=2949997 RepID=A0ABY8CB80_9GAMM|nr:phosphate regulon sensor histidine kinase PhoR [Thiomicrorhabdus lithotrophica]WEJ63236.1 phosphate regulon sensor histidine kinase PhoR [Thiomicrorhabdus lithotrophica]